jgi:hypothetical protein
MALEAQPTSAIPAGVRDIEELWRRKVGLFEFRDLTEITEKHSPNCE